MTAGTSLSREANFVGARLRSIATLPVYRDLGTIQGRHYVYKWQAGTEIQTLHSQSAARGVWLCYVTQPVTDIGEVYAEDLQPDADALNDALLSPAGSGVIDGRYVECERRDVPHYMPIFDGTKLVELQLGGLYIVLTYLT